MCLFPRLIKNRKYTPNKKNGGVPPIADDHRKLYVAVGCGRCIECLKQKALQWKIRLNEEIRVNKYAYYVTFTFSPQSLQELTTETGLKECNAIAGVAVRRYLERWRKKFKKSQRHWFVTELGHENSERIHLHGIVFSNYEISKQTFADIWKYGNIRIGDYCNLRTINYISKYITKADLDHKGYIPNVFCSAGIGRGYTDRELVKQIHTFRSERTIEFYRFPNGTKCALPIYYRNKLFSEEQKEDLWIKKLNENRRFVMGVEIKNFDSLEGEARYKRVLRKARERNYAMGYGDLTDEWQKQDYNVTLQMMKKGKI